MLDSVRYKPLDLPDDFKVNGLGIKVSYAAHELTTCVASRHCLCRRSKSCRSKRLNKALLFQLVFDVGLNSGGLVTVTSSARPSQTGPRPKFQHRPVERVEYASPFSFFSRYGSEKQKLLPLQQYVNPCRLSFQRNPGFFLAADAEHNRLTFFFFFRAAF